MKFKVRETISLISSTVSFQTKHNIIITMCSSVWDAENILNVGRSLKNLTYLTLSPVTCKATRWSLNWERSSCQPAGRRSLPQHRCINHTLKIAFPVTESGPLHEKSLRFILMSEKITSAVLWYMAYDSTITINLTPKHWHIRHENRKLSSIQTDHKTLQGQVKKIKGYLFNVTQKWCWERWKCEPALI